MHIKLRTVKCVEDSVSQTETCSPESIEKVLTTHNKLIPTVTRSLASTFLFPYNKAVVFIINYTLETFLLNEKKIDYILNFKTSYSKGRT